MDCGRVWCLICIVAGNTLMRRVFHNDAQRKAHGAFSTPVFLLVQVRAGDGEGVHFGVDKASDPVGAAVAVNAG